MSLICTTSRGFAGPWSAQPLIGVAAEYASNPALVTEGGTSEEHGALVLESPLYFDQDDLHLALIPRVRYGGNTGYSSLTSNYLHLDANAKYAAELDVLTFTGAAYQDSSLLYAGGLADGIGVRRDTKSGDLGWQHALTERLQFQVDVNDVTTRYGQSSASNNLVDYNDEAVSPALSYALNELNTVHLSGGVSRYKTLNGFTDSDSDTLQLGLDHRINELWSFSGTAGYTKSTDQYHFLDETLSSAQNSAVYSTSLTRTTQKLIESVSVSRAVTPTGLAFLSRQDTVAGQINYTYSDRLSYAGGVTWADISQPLVGGGTATRRFYDIDASANYHLSEQWVVTVHATKVGQQFPGAAGQPSANPSSTGVSLQISRQFYQTNQ
jgi:hypothetical protein